MQGGFNELSRSLPRKAVTLTFLPGGRVTCSHILTGCLDQRRAANHCPANIGFLRGRRVKDGGRILDENKDELGTLKRIRASLASMAVV